ncbi:hypothetical protein GGF42_002958 [Coemansia sp. RSA 2424]|nr:hypothetical protein GGF42_002958 [Coemansia sp. RSA 2424]
MDNESFESFINQSLVDTSSSTIPAADNTEMDDGTGLENELLLQLLLSSVTPATIDPSSLTSSGNSGDDDADNGNNQGALLPSTLFAPQATLPAAVNDGAVAMLVDPPPSANKAAAKPPRAAAPPAVPPKLKMSIAGGGRAPPAKKTGAKVRPPAGAAGSAAAAAVVDRSSSAAAKVASGLASPGNEFDDLDMADEDEDMEGIDVKNLSSKERRQLRNKISARNFRVRRKEYISNLEAEVRMHKEEADGLRAKLVVSRKDNSLLRDEVNKLRQRLGAVAVSSSSSSSAAVASSAPVAPVAGHVTPALTRPPAPTQTPAPAQAQPPATATATATASAAAAATKAGAVAAPPMSRFNPHKDIGQTGAKKDGNWTAKNGRSGFIAVNTATVPAGHAERLEGLVADVQRRRAVEALLSIGDDIAVSSAAPADTPEAAVLAVAALVAEFVMSQVALESSFALAHASATSVRSSAAPDVIC